MPARSSAEFLRQVCRRATAQSAGALPDAQLLELFVRQRHEAAFEVLVWRHGPLVLGVCRRLRLREQDAADVFQATFLTLVKKAKTIRQGDCLGSWLYQVAYRIAQAARTKNPPTASSVPVEALPDHRREEGYWADIAPMLDEEVLRLPARYRTAFVLCCLEGFTQAEAATHLGCPEGTVASRLAWARQRLRARLSRRGITLAAGSLTLIPLLDTVPRALAFATVQAAWDPLTPAKTVLPLAKGALPTMFTTRPLVTALLLACFLGVAASIGLTTLPAEAQEQPPTGQTAKKAETKREDLPRAVLLARTKHKNYMKACFSFKHGTNDDPDLKITHNRWDVLYGNGEDTFSVNMVGGDQSSIIDLGKLHWADLKDHPLLPPLREAAVPHLGDLPHVGRLFRNDDVPPERADDVPVKLGHVYLVHSKSDEYELFALFRVEEHTPMDRVVITWKVIPEAQARQEEKRLHGSWSVTEVIDDGILKQVPTSRRLTFTTKGRFGVSAGNGVLVGEYRLVGTEGKHTCIDLVEDEGRTVKGIVAVKDGTLTLVVGTDKNRPTSLQPGPDRIVMVLKPVTTMKWSWTPAAR